MLCKAVLLLFTPFHTPFLTVCTYFVCFSHAILDRRFLKPVTRKLFLDIPQLTVHVTTTDCITFCNISATLLFYFRNISSQKSSITEDGKIDGSPTTNISCNDFTAEAKPSVSVVSPMCIKSISSSLAPRQHAKPDIGVVFPLILLLGYHETYPEEI